MKSTALLSNKFKIIGWIFLVLGFLFGIWYLLQGEKYDFFETNVFAITYGGIIGKYNFTGWIENNILDEISSLLIILGGLLVMFTKEKNEDEFIASLRLNALSWAVIINYAILIVSVFFVYDMPFFWILVFNMFTILLIFILRFYWLLNQASKKVRYEE